MNYGFNKRGIARYFRGNRRPFSKSRRPGRDDSEREGKRHPTGLRGREIGLWYARKNAKARETTLLPSLSMDAEQASSVDRVMSVICSSSGRTDWSTRIDLLANKSYSTDFIEPIPKRNSNEEIDIFDRIDGIAQSNFKDMYIKNIKGNKLKMEMDVNNTKKKEFKFARSSVIDEQRKMDLLDKLNNEKYREMMMFRKKLPSFNMKENILSIINSDQAVVLSGETGCGKTTQVPQFILDEAIENKRASTCRIVCTQPRRISAISVAKRVADERAEQLGLSVGYQIRLEKIMPCELGSIVYCTTGIVLQWLQTDPFLSEISHLIIDEVHERDSLSDFLLCVAKDILPYRPDLKVVLMSATLNAEQFSNYFGNCPKIHIPGYTFSVEEFYLEDIIENLRFSFPDQQVKKRFQDPDFEKVIAEVLNTKQVKNYSQFTIKELMNEQSEQINYDLIMELLRFINRQPSGAILVFVPGWEEISNIHKLIQKDDKLGSGRCLTIPLHSLMPTVNQKEVFNRPPKGMRKIILATNIAETSITIDDIVYVINCGKMKMKNYDKKNKLATLQSEWIALANARQRRGRAGRIQKGICFHLYTRAREARFDDYSLPEIQRTQLEEVVLTVKILQLGMCEEFLSKIMEPPDTEVVQISLKLLKSISALDSNENLTPLGYHLARLPVDPFIGKMLLTGALFSCLDPILTIAAALAFKDPFVIPLNKEKEVNRRQLELDGNRRSDHLLLVTVYNLWDEAARKGKDQQFIWNNFLSSSVMHQLKKLRSDFMKILQEHNFIKTTNPYAIDVNRNSTNDAVVRAVITAGLYPNVARIISGFNGRTKYFKTPEGRVDIHPKSVNADQRLYTSDWLAYWKKMRTSKVYLYDTTMVDNFAVLFFGEKLEYDNELKCIQVDSYVKISCEKDIYIVVKKLRDELNSLLEHKISHPNATNWSSHSKESYLLELIIALLSDEQAKYL